MPEGGCACRHSKQDRYTHSAADGRGHSCGASRGAMHRRLPEQLRGHVLLAEQLAHPSRPAVRMGAS